MTDQELAERYQPWDTVDLVRGSTVEAASYTPGALAASAAELERQKNPVFIGGELEEAWIVRSGKGAILSSYNFEVRNLAAEGSQDPAVEVFVGEEAQH